MHFLIKISYDSQHPRGKLFTLLLSGALRLEHNDLINPCCTPARAHVSCNAACKDEYSIERSVV